jgi:hypothetical protein
MHDLESSLGQRLVNCGVDRRIGPLQFQTSDADTAAGRFCGSSSGISTGKPVLQKIHSFHGVSDILSHGPDHIQMSGLQRIHAFDRNQTERRFQADDAATGGRDANGPCRVGPEGHIGLPGGHCDRAPRRGTAGDQAMPHRIPGRPEIFIHAGGRDCEFRHVGFTDNVDITPACDCETGGVRFGRLMGQRKKFEPAVVTTPFMSMLSLIASRKRLLSASAGHCLINERSPGRCLVNSGTAEHPLSKLT